VAAEKPAAAADATPVHKPAEKPVQQKMAAKEPPAAPVRSAALGSVSAGAPRAEAGRPADSPSAGPVADDGRFLSDVEEALADAPPPAAEPADPGMPEPLGPPVALNNAPDAGWGEPDSPPRAVPKRLQPPADIPDVEDAYPVDNADQDSWLDEPAPDEFGGLRPIRHWAVLGVQNGRAIVDGRDRGVFLVEPGSFVPGLGTVEEIRRRGGGWVVVTSQGVILSASDARQGRL
jgi:hypothetical protein